MKQLAVCFVGLLLTWMASFMIQHYKPDLEDEYLFENYSYVDSRFIDIDGTSIHYRQTGEGQPLVLVHGFGANLRNWDAWHQILSGDLQVTSLDLPGYGLTGRASQCGHSDECQIDFLHRFVDKVGIDSFVLAGNSMGGGIAWKYSLAHPEKVRKLVLINSAGYPAKATSRERVVGFRVLRMPVLRNLTIVITPRFLLRQSLKRIYGNPGLLNEAEIDEYLDIMRKKGNRQVLIERMNAPRIDESQQIRQISTPTLIMWGDQDVVIDVSNARHFTNDIQGAEEIIYEGIGHVPMIEIPERSAKDLLTFVTSTRQTIKNE